MGTFRHHPDGHIFIDDVQIPLAEFIIEEPAYELPSGSIGREYYGSRDRVYTVNSESDGGAESELDGYISKLALYQSNIQGRADTAADSSYASDLAGAKLKRKEELAAEAVTHFNAYSGKDLERTQADLNTHKADLISKRPTIVAEVDALTSIKAVREYQYTNWPTAS